MTIRVPSRPTPPVSGPNRPPGRPRDPAIGEAIVQAAMELLATGGVAATTVTAVAARAGVAKATVYLRWSTRDALIVEAIRRAMGAPPLQATDDLEGDMRAAARFMRSILARPSFVVIFPEIVRAVLKRPPAISYNAMAPGRMKLAELYAANAESAGFRRDVDPQLVADLIVGSQISHLLASGSAPDAEFVEGMTELLIGALRVPARGG